MTIASVSPTVGINGSGRVRSSGPVTAPTVENTAFKRTTGRTPHRYLTELRIAKACELLQNPHRSIVDVSLAVGFSSQSHLTTVFRRLMKTTPAAYREEVLGLRSPRIVSQGSSKDSTGLAVII